MGNGYDQSPTKTGEENERQKQQHQLGQSKAITMAEQLKDRVNAEEDKIRRR
jgi:hypothetical protein